MIHALEPSEYHKARPLFPGQHLSLVMEAVIAGNSPGELWVDARESPQSALLWDRAHGFYLAGVASNSDFNREAGRLLAQDLLPQASGRGIRIIKVYPAGSSWEPLAPTLFPGVPLEWNERVFYRLASLKITHWQERIPPGFSLAPLEQSLLQRTSLKNIEAVIEEIQSCWNSLDLFWKYGFGYCLYRADEVVGWCTTEYASRGQCGIGIETIEEFTNRGFATLTACACAARCLSTAITPYWDSWKWNRPSTAVAEKVGFEKTCEYGTFLGKLS